MPCLALHGFILPLTVPVSGQAPLLNLNLGRYVGFDPEVAFRVALPIGTHLAVVKDPEEETYYAFPYTGVEGGFPLCVLLQEEQAGQPVGDSPAGSSRSPNGPCDLFCWWFYLDSWILLVGGSLAARKGQWIPTCGGGTAHLCVKLLG